MQVIDGPAILAFNYAGGIKGALCRKIFTVPHGLSIDHKGMLWATDVKLHQIMRIDPNSKSVDGSSMGRVTLTLGTRNSPGRGSTQFNKPTDVAVHPTTNEVYVADGYGNSRIIVFTYEGKYVREWGAYGTTDGRFHVPHSIAIDRRGDVYVADRENSRVQVFESGTGRYKSQWLSRVASSPQRTVFSRHVSSISYHPVLDVFAVTEGDGVTLRTPSGCPLVQTDGNLRWPHDAVLVPSAALAGGGATVPNRSAVAHEGAQYALFVAELQGKRIKRFNSVGGVDGGRVDPYG